MEHEEDQSNTEPDASNPDCAVDSHYDRDVPCEEASNSSDEIDEEYWSPSGEFEDERRTGPQGVELGYPTRSGRLDDVDARYCPHCTVARTPDQLPRYAEASLPVLQEMFHENVSCEQDHTMSESEAVLCNFCKHLRIRELFSFRQPQPFTISLGDVDDILSPDRLGSGCVLCKLLHTAISSSGRSDFPEGRVMLVHFNSYDTVYLTIGAPDEYNKTTIGLISRVDENASQPLEQEIFQLHWLETYEQPSCLPVSKHHVGERINWEQVRSWLHECDSKHKKCTSNRSTSSEMPEYFRVIDVQERRLTSISAADRYVALSYVWGSVIDSTKPLATLSNFDELHQVDGLVQLPATIEDALEICKSIEERYLWVDSLCIPQDDQPHKQQQIAQMDKIYASATVVLVIASTSSMHEGIRGVSSDRVAPLNQQIMDIRLLQPRHAPWKDLCSSKWAGRGWTYQEAILAKRKLFFMEGETWFQCGTGVWRESPWNYFWNEYAMYRPSNQWLGSLEDHSQDTWKAYTKHVGAYTQRSLSHDGDIFNAFAGILRGLFPGDTGSMSGLPEACFDMALLWSQQLVDYHCFSAGFFDRYGKNASDFTRASVETVIPSWSWGSVKTTTSSYDDWVNEAVGFEHLRPYPRFPMNEIRYGSGYGFVGTLLQWFYEPSPNQGFKPICTQSTPRSWYRNPEPDEYVHAQTYMALAWSLGCLETKSPLDFVEGETSLPTLDNEACLRWPCYADYLEEAFSSSNAPELTRNPAVSSEGGIFTRAQCAVLEVVKSAADSMERRFHGVFEPYYRNSDQAAIVNADGGLVGFLKTNALDFCGKVRPQLEAGDVWYEFMALSVEKKGMQFPFNSYDDERTFVHDAGFGLVQEPVLNVMLIEWDMHGYAHRMAIAQVYLKEWSQVDRYFKDIALR